MEEKLGHRYEKVSVLADDPTVPRAAYVSTEAIGGAEGGLIGGPMYVGAVGASSRQDQPSDTCPFHSAAYNTSMSSATSSPDRAPDSQSRGAATLARSSCGMSVVARPDNCGPRRFP